MSSDPNTMTGEAPVALPYSFFLPNRIGLVAYLLLCEKEPSIGKTVRFTHQEELKFHFDSSCTLADWELEYNRSRERRHDMMVCHVKDRVKPYVVHRGRPRGRSSN